MKSYVCTLLAVFAVILGCNTQNKATTAGANANAVAGDTVRIANDELEYEVIIIDPGFTSWLNTRARARGYYSQSYLETKNRLWIMEWNTRVTNPRYSQMYQMRIDYDSSINYGYEVNYLIYNYLVYFQQTNGQRLGGVVPSF
jgi:hypothetical protein